MSYSVPINCRPVSLRVSTVQINTIEQYDTQPATSALPQPSTRMHNKHGCRSVAAIERTTGCQTRSL